MKIIFIGFLKAFMIQFGWLLGGSIEEILQAVNDRDGWRCKCREAVEGWPQP